jgi:hypothetical protein
LVTKFGRANFPFLLRFLPNMSMSKDGPSPACSSSDEDFEVDAILAASDLGAIGSQFSILLVSLQQELATP